MSHTANSQTANYVWDVNRGIPEILQDGTNTYVYGLGRISSTDGSGVQTYYDSDGLGSTVDLTNSSAAKTDSYTYDAFGAPTHSPGSSGQPFQFTGQQYDGASGDSQMEYLRARYYDSSTGRFLGMDPVGGSRSIPSTQNRYAYALNNPATLVDPLGLCSLSCEGGGFGGGGGGSIAEGPFERRHDSYVNDFFGLLRQYQDCVTLGVGLALLVLSTPLLEAVILSFAINSAILFYGENGQPGPIVNGSPEVAAGTIADFGPAAGEQYAKAWLTSHRVSPEWAKAGKAGVGTAIAGLLLFYSADQCAGRIGLFGYHSQF